MNNKLGCIPIQSSKCKKNILMWFFNPHSDTYLIIFSPLKVVDASYPDLALTTQGSFSHIVFWRHRSNSSVHLVSHRLRWLPNLKVCKNEFYLFKSTPSGTLVRGCRTPSQNSDEHSSEGLRRWISSVQIHTRWHVGVRMSDSEPKLRKRMCLTSTQKILGQLYSCA